MNLEQIVREVSVDLNDHASGFEFLHWTEPQLKSYAVEILGWLSDRDKLKLYTGTCREDLVRTKVVPVAPGPGWTHVCGCDRITRVLGECTKDGIVFRHLRAVEDDDNLVWLGRRGAHCADGLVPYTIDAAIISNTSNAFRINPPQPMENPGEQKYVLVECRVCPEEVPPMTTVPDSCITMVKQWMLYRALAVDTENNPAIVQLSENHKATFFRLYDETVKQYDKEYERKKEDERYRDLRAVQDAAAREVPRRTSV